MDLVDLMKIKGNIENSGSFKKDSKKVRKSNFKEKTISKNWAITDFTKSNIDLSMKIFKENKNIISFLGWKNEICPKTEKHHKHIFLQTYEPININGVQDLFNDTSLHCEVVRDNRQYWDYVCKEETTNPRNPEIYTLGSICLRDNFSVADNIIDLLMNDPDIKEIDLVEKFPRYYFNKYGIKGFKALMDKKNRNKWIQPDVEVIVGEAGVGKTRSVYEKHGYDNVFTADMKMLKTDFWGQYDGEKVLLIDDFNGWVPYTYMLKILDGHPLQLNIKNGHTYKNWSKVYITSNQKPALWYNNIANNLKRRLSKVLIMDKDGNTDIHPCPFNRMMIDDFEGYDETSSESSGDEVFSSISTGLRPVSIADDYSSSGALPHPPSGNDSRTIVLNDEGSGWLRESCVSGS